MPWLDDSPFGCFGNNGLQVKQPKGPTVTSHPSRCSSGDLTSNLPKPTPLKPRIHGNCGNISGICCGHLWHPSPESHLWEKLGDKKTRRLAPLLTLHLLHLLTLHPSHQESFDSSNNTTAEKVYLVVVVIIIIIIIIIVISTSSITSLMIMTISRIVVTVIISVFLVVVMIAIIVIVVVMTILILIPNPSWRSPLHL